MLDMQIPAARWAGPEDTDWDRYYADFEYWVNENYNMETQTIEGRQMTWEQACQDEDLFEAFVEWWTDRSD
jgi:hypothetical protein